MFSRFLGLILTCALLTACASINQDDPDYQLGFHDGCDSGISYDPQYSKKVTRNQQAWEKSEMYRVGWKAGFNECRQTASGPERGSIPGEDMGRGR